MNTSAMIMMVFGLSVIWGGLIACITIALKNGDTEFSKD